MTAGHDERLGGRVAVVTGAAGGIGRAVAARLAGEGAHVVAVDRDSAGVHETAEAIGSAACTPAVVDLADRRARGGIIGEVVAGHGRVDILVNDAAYHGERLAFTDSTDDDWDRVLETNLTATASLCKDAAGHLPGGSGAIVNIGAIQEVLPVPTYAAYAASKGGIAALTRALAVELGPRGVRVNAVAPGGIETVAFRGTLDEAGSGEPASPFPALLRRGGRPEEAAAAVCFLASADASYITGTVLRVDGGRTLSRLPDPFEETLGTE